SDNYVSETSIEIQPGQTIVFHAVKGSFKVIFENCSGLFEVNSSNIEGIIHQDSKWETPIFKLDSSITYPFKYKVFLLTSEIGTTRAPSKKIIAIVG
ncbi:MAG TPA: hypothetical protein VF870_03025, partial [Ignavibacteriaceae bacterium]